MTHILHIDASATSSGSQSRAASAALVQSLDPQTVIYRDLTANPLPFVTEDWVKARLVPADARTDAENAALALSDTLIAELQAADTIVIGMPLYNFGMPANLKAWIDLIARPQVTFRYTENGPVGLLEDKTAHVAFASGGVPMAAPADFATPHMRVVLNFIGITDVTFAPAAEVLATQAA